MPDYPFEDLGATSAMLHQQLSDAKGRLERVQSMRGDIDGIRVNRLSPRGEVTVSCDASGVLRTIDIGESAFDGRPSELGPLILRTIQEAQREAGNQAVAMAKEAFGDDSAIATLMEQEVTRRMSDGPDAAPPSELIL